jgi:hypothetical protein
VCQAGIIEDDGIAIRIGLSITANKVINSIVSKSHDVFPPIQDIDALINFVKPPAGLML